MSAVKIPSNLPDLVRAAFTKAQVSGDLTYYPTQVTLLPTKPIPFQLRFCPALAQKPKPVTPSSSTPSSSSSSFDPFLNPSPALTVLADLAPNHHLILNKFAIIPDHAIIATRPFCPQTALLSPADFAAARTCLRAYRAAGEELFVFFNGGVRAGSSVLHRHLQMVPVARLKEGMVGWEVLVDVLAQVDLDGGGKEGELPFGVFVERLGLGEDEDGWDLHQVYMRLYRRACGAVGIGIEDEKEGYDGDDGDDDVDIEARIDYNLAMTENAMVLCPRVAEAAPLRYPGGREAGALSLNGMLLAGTALAKNEQEWELLKHYPAQLMAILAEIGIPPSEGAGPA